MRVVCGCALLAALTTAAWAAPEQWIEVQSQHFTVISDANEKEARHLTDQFERMRWLFQKLFPKLNVDPVSPIEVIAAKNSKIFQTLEPEAYLSKGALHLAGLFQTAPDKNYVLLRLDAEFRHPYASIYHEYTHLQFRDDSAWMPLWLNEGFAEFVQNTEIQNKEVLLGEASPDDILYLRQNSLIPLPVLFKVDHNSPYYHEEQKGSVFYSESWALTHFLEVTDKEKGTNRMGTYIQLLIQHEDPVTAAEKAFGDLKQLQNALESYIRAASFKQFILSSAAAPIDESTYKVRALGQPEADARRADFMVGVQRTKDAQNLIDGALKADPACTAAYEAKASLEYRLGHMEDARKAYGEAIQHNSTNYFAFFNYANLSLMSSGGSEDPEFESGLRKSIELNPRFYPASDMLAAWLSSRDRDADAIEVLTATEKVSLSPQDAARAQMKMKQIAQMQAARKQVVPETTVSAEGVVGLPPSDTSAAPASGPKHPDEAPTGPKHEAIGVIRAVKCSYPSAIEFSLEGAKRTFALYNNDYLKIDFVAAGYTPQEPIDPCQGLEGHTVRVKYAESSDKTVDGQVTTVELRK